MNEIVKREKDYLFEALIDVLGYSKNDLTRNIRGQINNALKQLREVNASPEDIYERALLWTEFMYCDIPLTAMGFVNRWADLTPQKAAKLMTKTQRDRYLREYEKRKENQDISTLLFNKMLSEGKIDKDGNPTKKLYLAPVVEENNRDE